MFHAEFEDDPWLQNPQCTYVDPNNPGAGRTCQFNSTYAGYLMGGFADRTENSEPELFSLQSITYPTGGKTTYEYEPNSVFSTLEYGGGIRIRKITSNDLVNDETLIREYKYGTNENGYGEAELLLNHEFFATENISLLILRDAIANDKYGGRIPLKSVTYSTVANTDIDLSGYLSGYVSYPMVTEYFTSTDPDHENGKIEYIYALDSQYNANPFPSSLPFDNCKRDLLYAANGPMYVGSYSIWDKPFLEAK